MKKIPLLAAECMDLLLQQGSQLVRERGAPGLEQYEHPKVRSELRIPWFSLLTLPQALEQLHKRCGLRSCYCC